MMRFASLTAAALMTAQPGPAPAAAPVPAAIAPAATLLRTMAGTWDVEQRLWTGPDATAPRVLARAIAVRKLAAGGGFIDEEMLPAEKRPAQPFTRLATLNYNPVDGLFEYATIDSRAAQQMHFRSQPIAPEDEVMLELAGGTFVAAEWGDWTNAGFAYRIELSPVIAGKQRLALFLRPLATGPQREFLAIEYLYTRRGKK